MSCFDLQPGLNFPVAHPAFGGSHSEKNDVGDIDLFEINEAFASVAMWSTHLLGIDHDKVNIHGGAVALGHPLGATGARIVVTLINALRLTGGTLGAAALCGGGGQGDALIVRMV